VLWPAPSAAHRQLGKNSKILIFCRRVLVETIRGGKIKSRNFHSTYRRLYITRRGRRMRSWQRTATFLAFALVSGVLVFAGHFHTSSAPGVDAKFAAAEK
jgi:hypothetical protein